MPAYISNPTDKTVYLRSFDGDSVSVHAKSHRVKVAQKFLWQIPQTQPPLRVEDAGEDVVDVCRVVAGRALPEPAKRPRGHHNKSRSDPQPFSSPKQYYEKLARVNAKRADMVAAARRKIEARFTSPK